MVPMISFLRSNAVIPLISIGTLLVTSLSAQRQPQQFVEIAEDFSRGSGGWLAGFSNYGFGEAGQQRLAEIRVLPTETGSRRKGYYLQAINHSDDIFSFLKRPLEMQDGIEPGASYEVEFLIEFASNAPTGCFGVGGSPGDDVHLKVGGALLSRSQFSDRMGYS
jgi:hypothetical protein